MDTATLDDLTVYSGELSGNEKLESLKNSVSVSITVGQISDLAVAAAQLAAQAALLLKADLDSPHLINNPTAPTPPEGNSSTLLANTEFVGRAISILLLSIQEALLLKAPLNSPTLTGAPLAPTPSIGDISELLATTRFVDRAVRKAVSDLLDSSPESLDTLKELAHALGNDPEFATTVLNKLAGKVEASLLAGSTGAAQVGALLSGVSGYTVQSIIDLFGQKIAALEVIPPAKTQNRFINSAMMINQRGGQIDEIGRYQILSRPYRFDSTSQPIVKPDGSYEDLAFNRGVTLDRWLVYINDYGQTGGAGFVEQVRCIDAATWVATTVYGEGALVRAPAGLYGDGYVYRCIQAHTSSGAWNNDVKTAINPTSWELIPRYWAIYGLYETDPALQNKFALHWKQTAGSSAAVSLEQRILGVNWVKGGTHTLSFLAKNRDGSNVPSRASVVQEMGVGQTDYANSSAPKNITGSATLHTHQVTLTDPKTSKASGFAGNNRMESVQVHLDFTSAGQTFDLLITDVQFQEGVGSDFVPVAFDEEISRCQAYFWKTNPPWLPARCASYVADAVGGTPQFNVLPVDQLWDRYGQMTNVGSGESIAWGGTNRAFPNNERETAGIGKIRRVVERQAKAYPDLGRIGYPREMIRPPTVKVFDLMGAMEGYAVNNERFKASLKFDYTGAGSSARPFSQRSLTKVATFYSGRNAADFQSQNFDPNTIWEEFSSPVTIPGGQDAIGSAFLTLFGGYKYDWDWTQSGTGTNVFYLHLANTQYFKNGAGSLVTLNSWVSGGAYVVGDVVQVSGTKRFYECMIAHTSGATAPDDSSVNWRPYGRVSLPHRLRFEGATVSERVNISNPATMGGYQWYFGDVDSLGFKTVYVRMNAAPTDPGSAAGRIQMQSYDQNLDLYENMLFQATFDAEILSL